MPSAFQEPSFYLTLLQVDVALLAATMVFLGLIQASLGGRGWAVADEMQSLEQYWSSRRVVLALNSLVASAGVAAFSSGIGSLWPSSTIGILAAATFAFTLFGVAVLSSVVAFGLLNRAHTDLGD